MFRHIFALIRIFFIFIGLAFGLSKVKRISHALSERERNQQVYKTPQGYSQSLIRATGSTVTVKGLEKIPQDTAVLFVGNHQSYFDIPLLLGYLNKPMGFISKAEMQKIPVISGWMTQIKGVFMNRDDRRQSLKAIKEGIETLKKGHSMVIFPEGTRSKDGKLLEFKPGSLTLATKSGVPIVPITINGTMNIFEGNNNKIKPAKVVLTVGDPIYMEDVQELNSQELTKIVEEKIEEHLAG